MAKHPSVSEDVKKAADGFISPLTERKKLLFACRENACRSQMAAAFAQHFAGDRFDVLSAGSEPVEHINSTAADVMQEKGIDMAFRQTRALDNAVSTFQPQMIITMGCGEACPFLPGVERRDWNLPDPAGRPIELMRTVRDEIARNVKDLVDEQG
jgi:protein-tyrosine-phosphatase